MMQWTPPVWSARTEKKRKLGKGKWKGRLSGQEVLRRSSLPPAGWKEREEELLPFPNNSSRFGVVSGQLAVGVRGKGGCVRKVCDSLGVWKKARGIEQVQTGVSVARRRGLRQAPPQTQHPHRHRWRPRCGRRRPMVVQWLNSAWTLTTVIIWPRGHEMFAALVCVVFLICNLKYWNEIRGEREFMLTWNQEAPATITTPSCSECHKQLQIRASNYLLGVWISTFLLISGYKHYKYYVFIIVVAFCHLNCQVVYLTV